MHLSITNRLFGNPRCNRGLVVGCYILCSKPLTNLFSEMVVNHGVLEVFDNRSLSKLVAGVVRCICRLQIDFSKILDAIMED